MDAGVEFKSLQYELKRERNVKVTTFFDFNVSYNSQLNQIIDQAQVFQVSEPVSLHS